MTKTHQLFNLLLGKEPDRAVYQSPFEINGKVYATDAKALIRCDREVIDFEFTQPDKHPSAEKLIPERNVSMTINLDDIKFKDYSDRPCPECSGRGTVRWTYGEHEKTDECPECNGAGSNSWAKALVRIGNAYIHIGNAYLLQSVRIHEGKEIKVVRVGIPVQALLFEVGNFEVLTMPVWTDGEGPDKDEWQVINIDIK